MLGSRQNREKTKKVTGFFFILLMIIFAYSLPGALSAGPKISDQTVKNAVEDELLFDKAVPVFLIDVACSNGIVTLDGTVDNLLAKDRALRITETVKGVRSVINRIQVSFLPIKGAAQLRKEISQALIDNPATESYEINISAEDSTVFLRGNVDSLREKNLVETVVKGVRGVISIKNDIRVSMAANRSDKDIRSDITQGLRWNALVDHELIKVNVDDGTAYLTGVVGSAAEKNQAVISAWVSGIRRVETSGLDIRYWARDPALRRDKYDPKSDKEIKTAILAALDQDPRVSADNVSVWISEGIVTLSGRLDSLKSCRIAAQDARNTVGVTMVKNHLKAEPLKVSVKNGELEQKIENAFKRDTYISDYEIFVDVKGGVANLHGTVDHYFEKARAEDTAATIRGIYAVNNYIRLQQGWFPYNYNPFVDQTRIKDYEWYSFEKQRTQKSDQQILRSIKEELWWSPFVDSQKVNVDVDDGRATLTGQVDSTMEYDAATENALEGGALSVDNELVISNLAQKKKK